MRHMVTVLDYSRCRQTTHTVTKKGKGRGGDNRREREVGEWWGVDARAQPAHDKVGGGWGEARPNELVCGCWRF